MQGNSLNKPATREEIYQNREAKFAAFLDNLNSIQDVKREELLRDINEIYDLVLQVEMNQDLENLRQDRRITGFYKSICSIFKVKHLKAMFWSFVVGVIVTLIPTLIHISSLKEDSTIPYQFVANSIGYPKDNYVQMITTKEQVEQIKKSSGIRDKDMADIGSALKLGKTGLNLMPSDEMNAPSYHLKVVGPQKNLFKNVNGFLFQPDTLWSRDPIQFHLISTDVELEAAKKDKSINNRDLLQIGAGITCPTKQCFVTAKSTLETEYSKVVPICDDDEQN